MSWMSDQRQWSSDDSRPLSTPPASPVEWQTPDRQIPDSRSNIQRSHTELLNGYSTNCSNFNNIQYGKQMYSSGNESETSKSRSKFLCYQLGLMRKRRIPFTKQQVEVFENLFKKVIYPDSAILHEVAQKTGVSKARLKTWFANKRSRLKKERSNNKMKSTDFSKTTPCNCRCKIRLPPLKKHKSSIIDESSCNSDASNIYLDIDGHHLARKSGWVNSNCSCGNTKVNTQNAPIHINAAITQDSPSTRNISTTKSSKWFNSSGMFPLYASAVPSPLLIPSVVVSPVTYPNVITDLSSSVNHPQPHLQNYYPSYQYLLPPRFYSAQFIQPVGLCDGFVTRKDQTVPIDLSTSNRKDNYCDPSKSDNATQNEQTDLESSHGEPLASDTASILPCINNNISMANASNNNNSESLDQQNCFGDAFLEVNHSGSFGFTSMDAQQNKRVISCHQETAQTSVENLIQTVIPEENSLNTMSQSVTIVNSTESSALEMIASENVSTCTMVKPNTHLQDQADHLINTGNLPNSNLLNCETEKTQTHVEHDDTDCSQRDVNNNLLQNGNHNFTSNALVEGGCDIQKRTNEKCSVNENGEDSAAEIHLVDKAKHLRTNTILCSPDAQRCSPSAIHDQKNITPCLVYVPVLNTTFTQPTLPGNQVILNNNVNSFLNPIHSSSFQSGSFFNNNAQHSKNLGTCLAVDPVVQNIFPQSNMCVSNNALRQAVPVSALFPNGTLLPGYQLLTPAPNTVVQQSGVAENSMNLSQDVPFCPDLTSGTDDMSLKRVNTVEPKHGCMQQDHQEQASQLKHCEQSCLQKCEQALQLHYEQTPLQNNNEEAPSLEHQPLQEHIEQAAMQQDDESSLHLVDTIHPHHELAHLQQDEQIALQQFLEQVSTQECEKINSDWPGHEANSFEQYIEEVSLHHIE
ncbi:uncharacterized protein LOC121371349 [Gigantopelta aegis]|uniref:uncharacterized protein LOC121371349 n=1 Tax=Gigantopelta aegis TaxID=1735272 RepID=UPI001B88B3C3|nr:uncharacterized protein LOC121371349 [Gigantopelta aegis]